MIDCSCNVISDRHFKQAVEDNKDRLAGAPPKKAVGIVYHSARLLRDGEKHVNYRKPCRTCFESVAQHIRDAGIPLDKNVPYAEEQGASSCKSDCGGCTKSGGGACAKLAF